MTAFDAVILAGGLGGRLGGVDKASIVFGGATLLDRVVTSVEEANQIICVGPRRETAGPVRWIREHPPGGGPVAALAAGLDLVEAPITVVLAVDLPFVTPDLVSSLVERCADADAAMAEDGASIRQPLLAAYRTDSLRARLRSLGDPAGASMKALIEDLNVVTVQAPDATQDIDTPEDLESSHSLFDRRR